MICMENGTPTICLISEAVVHMMAREEEEFALDSAIRCVACETGDLTSTAVDHIMISKPPLALY